MQNKDSDGQAEFKRFFHLTSSIPTLFNSLNLLQQHFKNLVVF